MQVAARSRERFKLGPGRSDLLGMRWLPLAVLAALGSAAWWRRVRGASRQRRLMLLCRRAGLGFAPCDLAPDTAWLPFPIFGKARSGTENVVWDRTLGPGVRVFDLWYEDPSDGRTVAPRRWLTCGVVPLGASVPRLRIAPRELAHDVRDLLVLPDVRMELDSFNERFVVQAEDERFAFALLEQRMVEALLGLPEGVVVETNDDTMLLSAPRLPAEQVLVLFDVAVRVSRRVPRLLPSLYPPRPAEGPYEDRWLRGRWSADPIGD